jgi:hypothetical protein
MILLKHHMLFACKNQKVADDRDTPNKGTIYISVDESFKPVIEEQIKISAEDKARIKWSQSLKDVGDVRDEHREIQNSTKDSLEPISVQDGRPIRTCLGEDADRTKEQTE